MRLIAIAISFVALAEARAQDPMEVWRLQLDGINIKRVAVATDGGVFAGGVFDSTVVLGADTLYASGEADAFLAKLSPDGDFIWATSFGGPGSDSFWGLDADRFGGAVIGVNTPEHLAENMLISRFGADGSAKWSHRPKRVSGGYAGVRDLAVASDGSIHVTGYVSRQVSFGSFELRGYGDWASSDIMVVQYSEDGRPVWGTTSGSGNFDDLGVALAIGRDGDLYVSGQTFEASSKCPIPNRGTGNWLGQLTRDGTILNSTCIPDRGFGPSIYDLVTDRDGNVIATGRLEGINGADSTNIVSDPDSTASLVKFDREHRVVWAISDGTASRETGANFGWSVVIDAHHRIHHSKGFVGGGTALEGFDLNGEQLYSTAGVSWGDLAVGSSNDLYLGGRQTLIKYDLAGVPVRTETEGALPYEVALQQNYPNPFSHSTRIPFQVDAPTQLRLSVHDLLGRELSVVASDHYPAGRHEVTWDAGGFASGLFISRLEVGDQVLTRLLTVLR